MDHQSFARVTVIISDNSLVSGLAIIAMGFTNSNSSSTASHCYMFYSYFSISIIKTNHDMRNFVGEQMKIKVRKMFEVTF